MLTHLLQWQYKLSPSPVFLQCCLLFRKVSILNYTDNVNVISKTKAISFTLCFLSVYNLFKYCFLQLDNNIWLYFIDGYTSLAAGFVSTPKLPFLICVVFSREILILNQTKHKTSNAAATNYLILSPSVQNLGVYFCHSPSNSQRLKWKTFI